MLANTEILCSYPTKQELVIAEALLIKEITPALNGQREGETKNSQYFLFFFLFLFFIFFFLFFFFCINFLNFHSHLFISTSVNKKIIF